MKFEVPVFNDDGSVRVQVVIGPEEAAHLLQFAINFLVSTGMAAQYAVAQVRSKEDAEDQPDLFEHTNLQ